MSGSLKGAGVLLVNLGTPDAPTPNAVRKYLAQFLHDKRVVDTSRWIWCFILHGVILRIRPGRVSKLYQSVWSDKGSPLLVHSLNQRDKLQAILGEEVPVVLGMTYGNPSIDSALEQLKSCHKIIVLPLYPQFSSSTTLSVFDAIARFFKSKREMPALNFIKDYYDHDGYISALAASVEQNSSVLQSLQLDNPQGSIPKDYRLMMSFHGLPVRYCDEGDPYQKQCARTAELLAAKLGLQPEQWLLTFQSRVGREEWLKPYTDKTLAELPKQGVKHLEVICPGFSSDCLETLEEIDEENKQIFLSNGGERFHYIPCLNDSVEHIELMRALVVEK